MHICDYAVQESCDQRGGEGVTPKAHFLSRWGREMVRRGAKYVHVILGQPLKIAYKI